MFYQYANEWIKVNKHKTMDMKKTLILILIIFIPGAIKPFEQKADLLLLDFEKNKSINVKVYQDMGNDILEVISTDMNQHDTIKISNVGDIDTIYSVFERFLFITYSKKAGSGEHVRYTISFSLKNGLLYENLSLLTLHKSFSPDGVLQLNYHIKFCTIKDNSKYYLLLDEYTGTRGQKNNHIKLTYDNNKMIFYSVKASKDKYVCMNGEKINIKNKAVSKIILHDEVYVYFEGVWYQEGIDGCLFKW